MAVPNGGPPTEAGKIFVGGLSWDTTKESLGTYFAKFGTVSDSVIMVDSNTNKPRGFGFVTFEDQESVMLAVNGGPHILDGKTIDPKQATVKGQSQPVQQQQAQPRYLDSGQGNAEKERKIFVGGLSAETTEDDVRAYFTHYGLVKEVDLKKDKQTNRMRGFGFVTFDSEEVVEKVIRTHFHQINGKTVEAKKAEARAPGQSQGTQGQATTSYTAAAALAAYQQQYGQVAAAAAYGAAAGGTNARNYYPYQQYPYYYQQQWPTSYGGTGQQSSVSATGYSTQDAHVYNQTAAAEGYGTQSQTYGYDNTRQTPTAASYPQQTYGDSSANYVSTMGQHSAAAQQQRGGNYPYNN